MSGEELLAKATKHVSIPKRKAKEVPIRKQTLDSKEVGQEVRYEGEED